MSAKADRPQVRTAQDLERKYANLLNSGSAIEMNTKTITKVNTLLSQFITSTVGDLETLQSQLDGQINTYYGNEEPTLLNYPTSEWLVEDYPEHIDDLYYDKSTGLTYKFVEDNGTYSWDNIQSSLMSEILAIANSATDTADGKRRIFTTEPTPPYDNGDLWFNDGKILICQVSRPEGDEYDSQDFVNAVDYTDDTVANAVGENLSVLDGKVTRLIAENDAFTLNFETLRTLISGNTTTISTFLKYIRFENGNIILGEDGNRYVLKIENDRLAIYYNGTPISSWIQDKFTASQLNLGNYAFIPRENGSLGFRKVK